MVMDHGFKDPATMKLRDLVEWYKKIVRVADTIGTPTQLEHKEITQGYAYVANVVATAQGVPANSIMAMVQDVARNELIQEAQDEPEEA